MKNLIVIIALLIGTIVSAQNKNERATIDVDGVCMMCKERIEKACIKTKGVKSAFWHPKTHELKLIFDARKTNLDSIKKSIAAVGHDTKTLKASPEVYNSLHSCCKYREQSVIDDHKEEE